MLASGSHHRQRHRIAGRQARTEGEAHTDTDINVHRRLWICFSYKMLYLSSFAYPSINASLRCLRSVNGPNRLLFCPPPTPPSCVVHSTSHQQLWPRPLCLACQTSDTITHNLMTILKWCGVVYYNNIVSSG